MYSHEELISAVCAAGREGKTFTVKDVRTQLGFDSRDKKELSRFRRRLRAFEKAAGDQLEKLGNNSYRLRPGAFEQEPEPVPEPEVRLDRASGVFQSAAPANEPQPIDVPASSATASATSTVASASTSTVASASTSASTSNGHGSTADFTYAAQRIEQSPHRESTPRRLLGVASALVSGAFSASAAVSGKVRERGRNLRELLWSCVRSAPARKHAFARLRGWVEGLRPLSNEVREHLSALRQRVLPNRRRAA
jgi:hypothetical protein